MVYKSEEALILQQRDRIEITKCSLSVLKVGAVGCLRFVKPAMRVARKVIGHSEMCSISICQPFTHFLTNSLTDSLMGRKKH